jgi:hypothetical protein
MKLLLFLCLLMAPLFAQEVTEGPMDTPDSPTPAIPEAEDPDLLFTKGKSMGHVGDDDSKPFRRIIQRTIMLDEPRPESGAILTFDDQLIPAKDGDSSALEIATDLKKHHARAIFFANVPDNSEKVLSKILRSKDPEKEALVILGKRKPAFMRAVRALLKIKDGDRYVCEVFNHTAFHQNMKLMKADRDRFKVCIVGIRFIEECLDEAYQAVRPGFQRGRYFRFPFLHSPQFQSTRKALNEVFTSLGLLALGATQDSKDVLNFSPDRAFEAMAAARNNQQYTPTLKAQGSRRNRTTDRPLSYPELEPHQGRNPQSARQKGAAQPKPEIISKRSDLPAHITACALACDGFSYLQ